MGKVVKCEACGAVIPEKRLKAVPNTKYCVKCVDNFIENTVDPDEVCAKSSVSGRNGFAASD